MTLDSTRAAAVAQDVFWEPMSTCPLAVKVQLLGAGGVAVYSSWDGKSTFFQAWAPLPKRRRDDVVQQQL
jgi:hypothetical protein